MNETIVGNLGQANSMFLRYYEKPHLPRGAGLLKYCTLAVNKARNTRGEVLAQDKTKIWLGKTQSNSVEGGTVDSSRENPDGFPRDGFGQLRVSTTSRTLKDHCAGA